MAQTHERWWRLLWFYHRVSTKRVVSFCQLLRKWEPAFFLILFFGVFFLKRCWDETLLCGPRCGFSPLKMPCRQMACVWFVLTRSVSDGQENKHRSATDCCSGNRAMFWQCRCFQMMERIKSSFFFLLLSLFQTGRNSFFFLLDLLESSSICSGFFILLYFRRVGKFFTYWGLREPVKFYSLKHALQSMCPDGIVHFSSHFISYAIDQQQVVHVEKKDFSCHRLLSGSRSELWPELNMNLI